MNKKKIISALKDGYEYQISGGHYVIGIKYVKTNNELWMDFGQYGSNSSFSAYITYNESDLDRADILESALYRLVDGIADEIKNGLLEDLDLD